jgi:hypothetical protein
MATSRPIRLEVPDDPRYARIVRATLGACATLVGFSIERMEDVRLLADELFNALLQGGATVVRFDVEAVDHEIRVSARAALDTVDAPAMEIVRTVSRVVAPGYRMTHDDGLVTFAASIRGDIET